MGGILPFGCIFIQLFFILNSIWSHQVYYMFGFLLLGIVDYNILVLEFKTGIFVKIKSIFKQLKRLIMLHL